MSASKDPEDANPAIETFEQLCTRVEHGLGVKIPEYIKNILLESGFDNKVSLSTLSESNVSELYDFVMSAEYYDRHSSAVNWNEYFGCNPWYNRIKRSVILPGHKRLLLSITAYIEEADRPLKSPPKMGRLVTNTKK